MNKVSSKNKQSFHKKHSVHQNGTKKSTAGLTKCSLPNQEEILESETPIDTKEDSLKVLNGLVNGTNTGDSVTEKTEISYTSNIVNHDLKPVETSVEQAASASTSQKSSKRTKGKKRNILDYDDENSMEFDLITNFKERHKDDTSDTEPAEEMYVTEIAAGMDAVDIKDAGAVSTNEQERVENPVIKYVQYESELQMPLIMKIIQKDLSEPYSIYTYRYFIHNWPNLCFLAMCEDECVGAIVCKLDIHRKMVKRGYIAMLAVDKRYRKHGIGSTLVRKAIQEMIAGQADEVVLETEITNKPALRLYEVLGFVRDKRLFRYYLNGVDALRLKLWLR